MLSVPGSPSTNSFPNGHFRLFRIHKRMSSKNLFSDGREESHLAAHYKHNDFRVNVLQVVIFPYQVQYYFIHYTVSKDGFVVFL